METDIIYLNDKLHHTLWTKAVGAKSFDAYYRDTMKSSAYKELLLLKVNQSQYYDLLKSIYAMAHKSVAELMNDIGIQNSDLSNRLCIPKRTIENWKSGQRECPNYIKYMIVLLFDLPYLPAEFTLESRSTEEPTNEGQKEKGTKKRSNLDRTRLDQILKEQRPRSSILERTDYLGELIKNRKKNATQKEEP